MLTSSSHVADQRDAGTDSSTYEMPLQSTFGRLSQDDYRNGGDVKQGYEFAIGSSKVRLYCASAMWREVKESQGGEHSTVLVLERPSSLTQHDQGHVHGGSVHFDMDASLRRTDKVVQVCLG